MHAMMPDGKGPPDNVCASHTHKPVLVAKCNFSSIQLLVIRMHVMRMGLGTV